MRILVVCQYFWPEAFRVNDVCAGLVAQGHEVTVLTGLPNYPAGEVYPGYGWKGPWEQDKDGIKIIRVPLFPRIKSRSWQLALNYLSFAGLACLKVLRINSRNIDVVFVYQLSPVLMALPAILLKRLHGIPVVLYCLDLWPESVKGAGRTLPRPIMVLLEKLSNFIYHRVDRLLVSSRGFIDYLSMRGVVRKRLHYWPQSAEDNFSPVEISQDAVERSRLPAGFIVMFAGNIGFAQGFHTILEAAERLRYLDDLHWVILGDGSARAWVEQECVRRNLDTRVHLLGRHSVESMPRWFSLADAMLVTLAPNPAFALTLPAKVQAYMACGKPIIAAMDGEGAKVIDDAKAGYSCETNNPAKLAIIVEQMYRLPQEARVEMGRKGLEYAKANFDRNKLMTDLEACLQSAVNERKVGKGHE